MQYASVRFQSLTEMGAKISVNVQGSRVISPYVSLLIRSHIVNLMSVFLSGNKFMERESPE